MPVVTVSGANGQVFPVTYNTSDAVGAATALASAINAIVRNPGVSTQVLTAAGATTAPGAGLFGQLVVTNNGSTPFQVSAGSDQIIVVNGTAPVSVAGTGTNNVSVIAGSGGLTFNAGTQANGADARGVVVVAGDGNNVVGTGTGVDGSMFVQTGAGSDSILAVRGFNTVSAGLGLNFVGTGTANDLINTEGLDIIVGDTVPGAGGSDTITALAGGQDFIFGLSSTVTFVNASLLASTLVGGTGSDTVEAGVGGGLYFAGTGGNSSLVGGSGSVTLVGGGNGDQLFSNPNGATTGSAYLVAGAGSETISGAADARGITAFAGNNQSVNGALVQANTVVFGGAGNDTLYAGTGNATLVSGGGTDTFGFINGFGGGNDSISGFTAADTLKLTGYSAAAALASATVSGGNTLITLSDNTRITLTGFTSLTNGNLSS